MKKFFDSIVLTGSFFVILSFILSIFGVDIPYFLFSVILIIIAPGLGLYMVRNIEKNDQIRLENYKITLNGENNELKELFKSKKILKIKWYSFKLHLMDLLRFFGGVISISFVLYSVYTLFLFEFNIFSIVILAYVCVFFTFYYYLFKDGFIKHRKQDFLIYPIDILLSSDEPLCSSELSDDFFCRLKSLITKKEISSSDFESVILRYFYTYVHLIYFSPEHEIQVKKLLQKLKISLKNFEIYPLLKEIKNTHKELNHNEEYQYLSELVNNMYFPNTKTPGKFSLMEFCKVRGEVQFFKLKKNMKFIYLFAMKEHPHIFTIALLSTISIICLIFDIDLSPLIEITKELKDLFFG